mgnify:FL=1
MYQAQLSRAREDELDARLKRLEELVRTLQQEPASTRVQPHAAGAAHPQDAASLEGLRRLDELDARLSALESRREGPSRLPEELVVLRRQVDTLSAQVGRVEAQRDNLLRQLSSLEERAERAAGPAVPPAGQG